jgi:hypothetical protein
MYEYQHNFWKWIRKNFKTQVVEEKYDMTILHG